MSASFAPRALLVAHPAKGVGVAARAEGARRAQLPAKVLARGASSVVPGHRVLAPSAHRRAAAQHKQVAVGASVARAGGPGRPTEAAQKAATVGKR